jgi:hypothetical protein
MRIDGHVLARPMTNELDRLSVNEVLNLVRSHALFASLDGRRNELQVRLVAVVVGRIVAGSRGRSGFGHEYISWDGSAGLSKPITLPGDGSRKYNDEYKLMVLILENVSRESKGKVPDRAEQMPGQSHSNHQQPTANNQ